MEKKVRTAWWFGLVISFCQPVSAQTSMVTPGQPLRNALGVSTSSNVSFSLSQPINAGTTGNVALFSAQAGGRKTALVTVNGNTLTLDPSNDFRPGEVVQVAVPATLRTTTGAAAVKQVYQFTVAAATGGGTFGVRRDINVGASGEGVMADLTADGLLDVVAATAGGVMVFANQGNRTFAAGTLIPFGSTSDPVNSAFVRVADINNDGHLDLIIADQGSSLRIRKGDGVGGFGPESRTPVSIDTQKILAHDIDADGDLDLISSSFGGNVDILRNSGVGAGSFSLLSSLSFAAFTDIALADFDSDGMADLLVNAAATSSAQILYNNGQGAFGGANTTTVANNAYHCRFAVGDVDADGDVDIFVIGELPQYEGRVYRNNGNRTFSLLQTISLAAYPTSCALADVDGDRDLDALVGTESNTVERYLNNGLGTLGSAVSVLVSHYPFSMATGDLDNDGRIDFLTNSNQEYYLNLRFNLEEPPTIATLTPAPNATTAPLTTAVRATFASGITPVLPSTSRVFSQQAGGSKTMTVTTSPGGQLTLTPAVPFKAGESVIVTIPSSAQHTSGGPTPRPQSYTFSTLPAPSAGTFGVQRDINVGASGEGVMADLTADGLLDVVAATAGGVTVFANQGNRTFAAGTLIPFGSTSDPVNSAFVRVADINNDGHLDLLIADQGSSLRIRKGAGAGSFGPESQIPILTSPQKIITHDLDADGDLDLVINYTNDLTILHNQGVGSGNFVMVATLPVSGGTNQISEMALADFDADGTPDLLHQIVKATSNELQITYNNGQGFFVGNGTTTVANNAYHCRFAVGDVDADGDVDIFVIGELPQYEGRVYRNNGNRTFSLLQTISLAAYPTSCALADVDGDRDLDALVGMEGTYVVRYRNNGLGTLGSAASVLVSRYPFDITTGDLDNDGLVDFLANSTQVQMVNIRYNDFITRDLTISTTANVPDGGPWRNITVTNTGNATLLVPTVVTGAVLVQAGGGWNDGCSILSGPGSFVLDAGAKLNICNAQGISVSGPTGAIQVAGSRLFSTEADYEYRATTRQITGTGFTGARNLTVNAPSGLTLSGAASVGRLLTLTATSGNFTLNGQQLTLHSTAGQTALVVNAGAGVVVGNTATVQRYITPGLAPALGYRHLSAPVSGSTLADLAVPGAGGFAPYVNPAYNPLPTPALPATQYPNIFGFDETRGGAADPSFTNGWYSPAALTAPLTPGRGFSVYMRPLTPDFNGTLGNGNLTVSGLTCTGTFSGSTQKSGWHLLGNPYPAPIDWDYVTAGSGPGQFPVGMSGAISVYQSTGANTGRYLTRVGGVGSLPNGEVAMGQAFFARVTGAGPLNFTFTNALRVTSYSNPSHFRAAETRPLLRMTLRAQQDASGAQSEAFVYFDSEATSGLDARYDGPVPGHNVGMPTLVTLLPDGDELAINALPLTALASTVTLALRVDLPAAGTYELAAAQLENLGGATVQLLDRLIGTRYELSQQATIHFAVPQGGVISDRFVLVIGQRPRSADLSEFETSAFQVWPNPSSGDLNVGLSRDLTRVEVFNATGQFIRWVDAASGNAEIKGLAPGIYVLRAGSRVQRVVVR